MFSVIGKLVRVDELFVKCFILVFFFLIYDNFSTFSSIMDDLLHLLTSYPPNHSPFLLGF